MQEPLASRNLLGCRQCLPLPASNSSSFWIGISAKFTDKGLCASTESSDLLVKSPVRMTDKKYWGFLGMPILPLPTSNSGEFVWQIFRLEWVVLYHPHRFLPFFLRKTSISEHSLYCFATAVATLVPVPNSLSVVFLVQEGPFKLGNEGQ